MNPFLAMRHLLPVAGQVVPHASEPVEFGFANTRQHTRDKRGLPCNRRIFWGWRVGAIRIKEEINGGPCMALE